MTFETNKLTAASVSAQIECPAIIYNLLSVAREAGTPEWLARKKLSEARTATERLLVAILAAEQSDAPRPALMPANDAPTYDQIVDAVAREIGANA